MKRTQELRRIQKTVANAAKRQTWEVWSAISSAVKRGVINDERADALRDAAKRVINKAIRDARCLHVRSPYIINVYGHNDFRVFVVRATSEIDATIVVNHAFNPRTDGNAAYYLRAVRLAGGDRYAVVLRYRKNPIDSITDSLASWLGGGISDIRLIAADTGAGVYEYAARDESQRDPEIKIIVTRGPMSYIAEMQIGGYRHHIGAFDFSYVR